MNPLQDPGQYAFLTQAQKAALNGSTPIQATPEMMAPRVQQPAPMGGQVANNTVGNIYSNIGNDDVLNNAFNQRTEANRQTAENPVDESTIRSQTLASFQAEIDAQNSLFADKLASAKVTGADRLGSSRAIQSRRGLLGSDFGSAQTEKVNDLNTGIYSSIDNERNASIQRILTQARTDATAEIKAKTDAKKAGLDEYIKNLSEASVRKGKRADSIAQLIFSEGRTVDDLTSEDLDELQSQGISKEALKSSFNSIKSDPDKGFILGKGQTKFDDAGNVIAQGIKDLPASAEEYEYAVANGYTGTFNDYKNDDANRKIVVEKIVQENGGTTESTNITAQSWVDQFNSGLMSIEDIYTKISSSKEASVLKNAVARIIAEQGGKRLYGVDDASIQAINSQIKNIDDLLTGGIGKIAGFIQGGLGIFPDALNIGKQDVLAIAETFVANQTLQALADAKSKGITFGALSEGELSLVAAAAGRISSKIRRNKNGKITGFTGSERAFIEDLTAIKEGLEKSIATKTGRGPQTIIGPDEQEYVFID